MCYPRPLVLCSSLVLFVVLSLCSLPESFFCLCTFLFALLFPFSSPSTFLLLFLPFSSSFSCVLLLILSQCNSLVFLCSISVSQSVYDYCSRSLSAFLSVSVAYWFSISSSLTSSRDPFFFILLPHWSWAQDSQETGRWLPLPTRASGWHTS